MRGLSGPDVEPVGDVSVVVVSEVWEVGLFVDETVGVSVGKVDDSVGSEDVSVGQFEKLSVLMSSQSETCL